MRLSKLILQFLIILSVVYIASAVSYTFDGPLADDVKDGNITFSLNITDPQNISYVQFFLNGTIEGNGSIYSANVSAAITDANLTYYNTTLDSISNETPDGFYTVGVNLSDLDAYNVTVVIADVFIDNNLPRINIESPTPDSVITGDSILVNLSITDQGLQSVLLNISGRGNAELGTVYGNCSAADCGGGTGQGNFSLETISETTSVSSLTMHFNSTDITNTLGDGNYTFHFHANDSNSTRERLTVNATTFIVNNNPPHISVYGGDYLNSNNIQLLQDNASGNLSIEINITETGTDFDTVRFNVTNLTLADLQQVALITASNSTDANNGSVNTTYNGTLDTGTLPDGNYEIVFYLNDTQSNNLNSTESRNITIDNTVPNVTNISAPSASGVVEALNTIFAYSDVILNVTIDDSTMGVDSVYVNLTNQSGEEASFLEASQEFNVLIEWNISINSSTLGDGKYAATVFSNDTLDNRNDSISRQIRVNNLAPHISSGNSPTEYQNASGNLTITINASELGVYIDTAFYNFTNTSDGIQVALLQGISNESDEIEFNGTLDTTSVPDGRYTITWYINDTENLLNDSENITFVADNNGPYLVNITTPSAAESITAATFSLNITVNDSLITVDTIYFNITNESGTGVQTQFVEALQDHNTIDNFNTSFVSLSIGDGKYVATVQSNDTLNNQNNSNLVNRTFYVNALAPQGGSFNTPSITLQNVSANFTVNFTASELGTYVDTVFLNITNESDGVQVALVQGTLNGTDLEWNSTLDTGTLDDGNYTVTVHMNDTDNLLNNTFNATIHVDNTKPQIENLTVISDVAEAAANGSVGTNFSINLSLTELNFDTVIARIQYPDGNETQNVTLTRPSGDNDRQFNGILDSANLVDGTIYNIDIFANDTAGNTVERDNLGIVLVQNGSNTRGTLLNDTIIYAADVVQTVDAATAGNVTLGILMSASTSGSVTVVGETTNPTSVALPGNSLGRFVTVNIDSNSSASMTNSTVTMVYSDDDVPSGTDEANIVLYHLANGSSTWESLPPSTLLNTDTNTIGGTTTSFSTFALGVPDTSVVAGASSNSGGGGGGSDSTSAETGEAIDVGILSTRGKEVIMNKDSTIVFKYSNGEEHKITINEIDVSAETVTGTLQSLAQSFKMTLGDTRTFDLNDNGGADLKVEFTRIYRGRAYLTLHELEDRAVVTTAPAVAEPVVEDTAKPKRTVAEKAVQAVKEGKSGIVALFIVLLLVFGGLATYYYKKHGSFL